MIIGGNAFNPAYAVFPVIDVNNIAQAIKQVQQLEKQYQILEQQYSQLQQTYQALAHLPTNELKNIQSELNNQKLRDPLSTNSIDVGSIMNGIGPVDGALKIDLQTHFDQNHIYSPRGEDFRAQEMRREAISIAGTQAIAAKLYQSSREHIKTLGKLDEKLQKAKDAKDVADIQVSINMEHAALLAQQIQMQSIAMWQEAQNRNRYQRYDEKRRQEIDNLLKQSTGE